MSKINRIEVHHDVAEVDKTHIVHAGNEKHLFVRFVCIRSFLPENTLAFVGDMRIPELLLLLLYLHFVVFPVLEL